MVEQTTAPKPAPGGVRPSRSWLSEILVEMDGLALAAEADGAQAPPAETLEFARYAMMICSAVEVSQPVLDHDGAAGVEIYFKEGERALLVALRVDGDLCVFRDGPDGPSRDRRRLGVDGWTEWLEGELR